MKTAKQLLETYLAAISASDMERAIALFADDGGIEFPYSGSVNLPIRYQGPEALRRFFAPVMDGAENFKFKNIKIFPGEDENHVSGEYEVDAVIKNTGLTPFLRRWILAKCVGAVPTVPEQLHLLMVLACLAQRNCRWPAFRASTSQASRPNSKQTDTTR